MGKIDPTQRTWFSALAANFQSDKGTRAAGKLGLMFFLLRMAFWLGIVLILLPGGTQQGPSTNQVGAADALSAASATVHDFKGFCSREPSACTVGSELATTLGYRAQAGAKMLYDFLTETLASRQNTSLADDSGKSDLPTSSLQQASQNTLTPADLTPRWRGPALRKGPGHSA